jgi:hypothetical protein
LKDTFDYFVCINNKIECVADAIEQNLFNTNYFAWIDFGIYHVFKNYNKSSENLVKISKTLLTDNSLLFPGCWSDTNYNYLGGVCWKYAGGFFIDHKDKLLETWNIYKSFLPIFIKKYNLMTWEVNIWCAMLNETKWNPSWYLANHNDSIIMIPENYFNY